MKQTYYCHITNGICSCERNGICESWNFLECEYKKPYPKPQLEPPKSPTTGSKAIPPKYESKNEDYKEGYLKGYIDGTNNLQKELLAEKKRVDTVDDRNKPMRIKLKYYPNINRGAYLPVCRKCNKLLLFDQDKKFCPKCGQAIDWSEK